MIAIIEQPGIEMTVEQAEASIGELLQEIAVIGANDHEYGDVQRILDDMHAHRCTPTQAVERVNSIRHSKMEYR